MRRAGPLLVLLAVATVATSAPAYADPSGVGSEAGPVADTLFQRGKELMGAGRYAEACEAFAESNRIDPATGGTLLNLAVCHEKIGKIATACAEFEQARALARHYNRPDREQFASQHVAALRPRVPTLTLVVHDPTGDERVSLDGIALSRLAWSSLPVDPGDHEVAATAAGKVLWKATVSFGTDAASRTVDVPVLEGEPLAAPAPSPVPVGTPALFVPERAGARQGGRSSTQKTAGFTLGGLGLVALGVGAAFGAAAIEENSTSEDNCRGGCNPAGASDSHHAVVDANVANVCIVGGVVVLVVATVLVLTAPKRPPATVGEARNPFGLGGTW
jgi:hypothetical protein